MIYIATNKDNKDALMHYGVKGMRWGKRGGSFKWPWDRDDDNNKNRGKSKYGTAYGQRGAVGQASARDEIGRLRGASGVARSRNLYPDTATRRSPGSNISTGSRPQQNKLSTSQKTSSAPSKRTKEYFNRQLDRRRADERNQRLRERADYNQNSNSHRYEYEKNSRRDSRQQRNDAREIGNRNRQSGLMRVDAARSAQNTTEKVLIDGLRRYYTLAMGVHRPLADAAYNYTKNTIRNEINASHPKPLSTMYNKRKRPKYTERK